MSLYTLLGVMSGTSMDGIDIVSASYKSTENEQYTHNIHHAKTYAYPDNLLNFLKK